MFFKFELIVKSQSHSRGSWEGFQKTLYKDCKVNIEKFLTPFPYFKYHEYSMSNIGLCKLK